MGVGGTSVTPVSTAGVPFPAGTAADPITVTVGGDTGGDATAANQVIQITAEQAILAKLTSDPATQTTLAAILAKIIAAPATEATLAALSAKAPASLGAKPGTASLSIVPASDASFAVTGTFFQGTQPVSGTVSVSGSVAVTGTFWQATQPVSIATAPVLVAGSAIIGKVGIDQTAGQNVVVANAGTNLNTSALALDATLTGGTQQSKITDGTSVATVKAASTASVATDKALVVSLSPNNLALVDMGASVAANVSDWGANISFPRAAGTNLPTAVVSGMVSGSTTHALVGDATNGLRVYGQGFSFANITTSTTTTVKSGAGVLHTVTVNALGTVASTTTIYDNTAGSGTKIATINTLAGQESYIYDAAFATGLTIVTTGTVAPDITVSYR